MLRVLDRAREKRAFARELLPQGELDVSTDVWRDCRHGCDGECLLYPGPHECGYTCHPGRLYETDCAHGCNGDCVESGSDVCTFKIGRAHV